MYCSPISILHKQLNGVAVENKILLRHFDVQQLQKAIFEVGEKDR
jgi:hypothetical protein